MNRAALRVLAGAALGLSALLTPPAADAHHSFAMYDQSRIVTLNGTVKVFQWTNPHALLWVVSPASGGGTQLWSVELSTSPGNLSRMGWSKRSINPGDKVAVDINPLRDGRPGGSLKKVTLVATGKVLTTAPVGTAKP